jgi:hypothetical protein
MHGHAALPFSKNAGHTCPVLVSGPGFAPGLRESETRVLPIRRSRNCVGPAGVAPAPLGVRVRHAASTPRTEGLHFIVVCLFVRCMSHLEHSPIAIGEHTFPVERSRARHTRPSWARLESNQLALRPSVYGAGRFPETNRRICIGPVPHVPRQTAPGSVRRSLIPGEGRESAPRALKRREPPRWYRAAL